MRYKPLRKKQHELLLVELRMWREDAKAFREVLSHVRSITSSYTNMTQQNWDSVNLEVRGALNSRGRL